jgi:hypothetical protein
MKRLLCVSLLLLTAFSATGCTLLRKKGAPSKPKAVTALSSDTDTTFRNLWVTQRQKELVTSGLTPAAAATKATEEYSVKYGYTNPAR